MEEEGKEEEPVRRASVRFAGPEDDLQDAPPRRGIGMKRASTSAPRQRRGESTRFKKSARVVEHYISKLFVNLGRRVAENPGITLIVSTIFVGLCCVGLLDLQIISEGVTIWVPDSSPSAHYEVIVTSQLPNSQGAVIQTLYSVPPGQNALTKANVDVMWSVYKDLHDLEVDGVEYEELCSKGPNGQCGDSGMLAFWGSDFAAYQAAVSSDEDLLAAVSSPTFSDGSAVLRNTVLGMVTEGPDGEVLGAEAFITALALKSADGTSNEFLGLAQDLLEGRASTSPAPLKLDYFTSRSINDETKKAVSGEIHLVILSFIIMILFVTNILGPFDRVKGRRALGFGGVMVTILSTVSAYGFCSGLGIPFTALAQVLPFVLLGIGVDDMFIITAAFDNTNPSLPLENRVAIALGHCGFAITYTSMTDLCAFMLGSITSLPAVRYFCFYAGTAVLFDFIMQVTTFVALLMFDERRQKAARYDLLCCIGSGREVKNWRDEEVYDVPDDQSSVWNLYFSQRKLSGSRHSTMWAQVPASRRCFLSHALACVASSSQQQPAQNHSQLPLTPEKADGSPAQSRKIGEEDAGGLPVGSEANSAGDNRDPLLVSASEEAILQLTREEEEESIKASMTATLSPPVPEEPVVEAPSPRSQAKFGRRTSAAKSVMFSELSMEEPSEEKADSIEEGRFRMPARNRTMRKLVHMDSCLTHRSFSQAVIEGAHNSHTKRALAKWFGDVYALLFLPLLNGLLVHVGVSPAPAPFILRPIMKVVILTMALALLGVSIWGVMQVQVEFDVIDLTPPGSFTRSYLNTARTKNLDPEDSFQPVALYFPAIDYATQETQEEMSRIQATAASLPNSSGPVDSWMDHFRIWVAGNPTYSAGLNSAGYFVDSDSFPRAVEAFLATSAGSRFRGRIAQDFGSGRITLSEVTLFHVNMPTADEKITAMDELRAAASDSTIIPGVFAFSPAHNIVELFKSLYAEIVSNFVLVLIAVFSLSVLVLGRVRYTLAVTVLVAIVDMEILASIHFWGLTLNATSSVELIMAVGLVVDYIVHVLHAALHQDRYTMAPVDRVQACLREVGPSVLCGVSTTFLGVLPMSAAKSTIFQTFFKLFVSIVVLSGIHGLVVLPVLFSLITKDRTYKGPSLNAVRGSLRLLMDEPKKGRPRRSSSQVKASLAHLRGSLLQEQQR